MRDVGDIQHEHAGNQSGERGRGFGHIRGELGATSTTRQNLTSEGGIHPGIASSALQPRGRLTTGSAHILQLLACNSIVMRHNPLRSLRPSRRRRSVAAADVIDTTPSGQREDCRRRRGAAGRRLPRPRGARRHVVVGRPARGQQQCEPSIDARPGGCCARLPTGGGAAHDGRVCADPGSPASRGALGPLQAMAVDGSMTGAHQGWRPDDFRKLTYTVGGYPASGLGATMACRSILSADAAKYNV